MDQPLKTEDWAMRIARRIVDDMQHYAVSATIANSRPIDWLPFIESLANKFRRINDKAYERGLAEDEHLRELEDSEWDR